MPRCCQGGTCACLIQTGAHVTITGSGSSQDPYVITGDVVLGVVDTPIIDLTLLGAGTTADPWILGATFAATAKLDDLPDVNAPAPSNGHVIGWDSATSKWTNRAPTTAASGSVLHGTSLTGDGSAGTPLSVALNSSGFLEQTATGIGLNVDAKSFLVQHFANAASRTSSLTSPDLNQVTMLDDHPGQQDYWTGTAWAPVTNGIQRSFGTEMLALSGSYVAGTLVTFLTRQINKVTDFDGTFDVLDPTDLTGAAGVLSVVFQETGSTAYKVVLQPFGDRIKGTAFRLDNGAPYASAVVTGTLQAYTY